MIRFDNVTITAGRFRVENLSFEIPGSEYGVLMGPSGVGKTSILEALCGLRAVEKGRIYLMGQDVTNLKPAGRGVGYVPQDAALFSTMTVRDHLAFPLRIRKVVEKQIRERVAELASLLGLEGHLDRKPAGLSGGEAQRVALGRALSAKPSILCLDEPLSSLDESTRHSLCGHLEKVKEQAGVTALHVTHSGSEAVRLADRIFLFENGLLKMNGQPVEPHEFP